MPKYSARSKLLSLGWSSLWFKILTAAWHSVRSLSHHFYECFVSKISQKYGVNLPVYIFNLNCCVYPTVEHLVDVCRMWWIWQHQNSMVQNVHEHIWVEDMAIVVIEPQYLPRNILDKILVLIWVWIQPLRDGCMTAMVDQPCFHILPHFLEHLGVCPSGTSILIILRFFPSFIISINLKSTH